MTSFQRADFRLVRALEGTGFHPFCDSARRIAPITPRCCGAGRLRCSRFLAGVFGYAGRHESASSFPPRRTDKTVIAPQLEVFYG